MIDEAIAFAATAHATQTRKYTGEPYIYHPMEVSLLVRQHADYWDETMLAAAVLHDVVEDTVVGLETIERRFGRAVAQLVEELTEVEVEGNRKTRKAAEAARLAGVSKYAKTIKLADLISNTRSIAEHDPGFAKVYLVEKAELLPVLVGGDPNLRLMAMKQLAEAAVKLDIKLSL